SRTLDHDASVPVIEAAARRAASSLRATYGRALVRRLAEQAGSGGRAATGVPAVQRALRARAVDLLLVSPEFVRAGRNAGMGEDMVRAAIAQGADVEVLSGEAAALMNRLAEGVAARLRFSIEEVVPPKVFRRTRAPARASSLSTSGGNDAA
ncbi:MAG: hypothetical protein ACRENQ_04800, partial [Gemmatimonadaceae bacterium]